MVYLVRRAQRVLFSIFLCFFFRMRLRRFLISDPMRGRILRLVGPGPQTATKRRSAHRVADSGGRSHADPSFGNPTMNYGHDGRRIER